jgi:hypothetical protein
MHFHVSIRDRIAVEAANDSADVLVRAEAADLRGYNAA